MSTIYLVRSIVDDPADRAAFDRWYSTHHLPLVAERYGVIEAWRLWSDTDPSCHVAAYRFRDADHMNNQSQETRDFLRADYEASWGKLVRSKETLQLVDTWPQKEESTMTAPAAHGDAKTPVPGPKIMLVVPDTNTTMAQEVRALWPEIAVLEVVGVPRPMRPIVREDLTDYEAATLAAVRACPLKNPDIVLYGCTTAGFLGGPEGDKRMATALVEATGAPVITTASSMVEALRRSGVSRPAIVTPYLEVSNQALVRFLAAYGIEVAMLDSFHLKTVAEYNSMTKESVHTFATRLGNAAVDADGMFVACTQLPTLGILEGMSDQLNKPVRGAIEATVAAAKQELGAGPGSQQETPERAK